MNIELTSLDDDLYEDTSVVIASYGNADFGPDITPGIYEETPVGDEDINEFQETTNTTSQEGDEASMGPGNSIYDTAYVPSGNR